MSIRPELAESKQEPTPLPQSVGEVLFDILPDALFLVGPDGQFVRFNTAAKTLFPDMDKLPQRFLDACRYASEMLPASHVLERDDGLGWLEVSSSGVPEGGYLLRVRDITELRTVEEALKQRDERARLLVKAANDVIWWADPERGFVEPQEAWEEFTGQTFDEYKHWGHVNAIHPDDRERVQAAWMQASAEKRVCECGYRVYSPSKGEFRYCMARGVPVLNSAGELTEWVGTLADVQELKKVQEALEDLNRELESRVAERTAQLETSLKELESVAHAMSHDLRTAMRGVLTNASLLAESAASLSETDQESLDRIMLGTRRLADLIDDLLMYNRVSRDALDVREVDVSSVASRICLRLLEAYPQRAFDLEIQPDMRVVGDPAHLELALTSLLENAAKFSPDGGKITVGATEEGLFVRDCGIGFEPRYREHIFEPFRRLHRDEEYPGTGIGLALAARVAERHGGRVWAETERGVGSCFWISLQDSR